MTVNKLLNLKKNLRNSIAGLKSASADKSFRAELAMGFVLIPAILTSEAVGATLAAIGTYVILLAMELINTAIETLCDRVTSEYDEAIKVVKDIASAAVFLVLILFLAQCVMIFTGVPKL